MPACRIESLFKQSYLLPPASPDCRDSRLTGTPPQGVVYPPRVAGTMSLSVTAERSRPHAFSYAQCLHHGHDVCQLGA